MNLYKIEFSHFGPKSSEYGFKCLLIAESDEHVYEWIKSEPSINGDRLDNYWGNAEAANKVYDVYDSDYNIIGTETFKERMLRVKGELNDDDNNLEDAYYGITLYGWGLLKENVDSDYSDLIDSGIIYTA